MLFCCLPFGPITSVDVAVWVDLFNSQVDATQKPTRSFKTFLVGKTASSHWLKGDLIFYLFA